jgi:hypothetical protein
MSDQPESLRDLVREFIFFLEPMRFDRPGDDAKAAELDKAARALLLAHAPGFDLVAHLRRHMAFSEATFGPGARSEGVCDHIRKELIEVQNDAAAGRPALEEWVDVIILAFDGAWRSGATPEQIAAAIEAKQTKNEGRKWPDWRTADPNKAIEHDRSGEGQGAS